VKMIQQKKGNDNYTHSLVMLTFIVFLFFGGLGEIILGAVVSGIVSNGAGSWWAGLICLLFACVIYYRGIPSKITVAIALACMVVAIAGSAVDGHEWLIASELVTCASDETNYGDNAFSNFLAVSSCRISESQYDCSCVTSSLDVCYSFNLVVDQEDCDQILIDFPEALERSYIFCAILSAFCLIFSIFLCSVGCDWGKNVHRPVLDDKIGAEMGAAAAAGAISGGAGSGSDSRGTKHIISPLVLQKHNSPQFARNKV
jgi:TM2 domain-containing membrane protein YozV